MGLRRTEYSLGTMASVDRTGEGTIDGQTIGFSRIEADSGADWCPACHGLQCLERPRYFAGQLLTEEELNSEQAYVLAKNRLHNRYLHGPGVVCGLQVACHECEGWVTVKTGYAIDPCGNDVIVCRDHDFDVIEHIKKCRQIDRARDDCDPIRVARSETCRDVEEHWCLTIAYEEQEARPITALHQTSVCSTTARTEISACEPTRIYEGYRLGLFRAPAGHCANLKEKLRDTLLAEVVECFSELLDFVKERVPADALATGIWLMFNQAGTGEPPFDEVQDIYEACCYLRQAVRDLYEQNPFGVRCSAIQEIELTSCPLPPSELADIEIEDPLDPALIPYIQQVQESLYRLYGYVLQYLLDCVCQKLLPPCPPDPMDDHLVLACMTIKGNEIVHICNFSCRQHAGAFPSVSYWLSLVPIIPLISFAVHKLCCGTDLAARFLKMADTIDPTWDARTTVQAGNFAWLTTRIKKAKEVGGLFSLAGLAKIIHPKKDAEAVVKMDEEVVGMSPTAAEAVLHDNAVEVVWRDVKSADDIPILHAVTGSPLAHRGDKVVLYKTADKVVGYAPYDARAEVAVKEIELDTLRKELTSLRDEVEVLKRGSKAPSRRTGKS